MRKGGAEVKKSLFDQMFAVEVWAQKYVQRGFYFSVLKKGYVQSEVGKCRVMVKKPFKTMAQ